MTEFLKIFHIDWNFVNLRRDYVRSWLERIAGWGYNAILWEVEDKVGWDILGDTVWPEALSKGEFRELLDYAAGLGLEAIPLLQTIGHGEYVLKHERFRHLREQPDLHDCYCTENPQTRRLLKALICEYLEVFGEIGRFHLGGDEAYVFATCPVCLEKAGRIGRNGVYMEHILDLSGALFECGVKPGIWGDMILSHPREMGSVPTAVEIWDWNYSADDQPPETVRIWGQGGRVRQEDVPAAALEAFPEIIDADGRLNRLYTADALRRLGFSVILCSAARAAGDSVICPRVDLRDGNVAALARKAVTGGFAGTCVTSWGIRLNSWELQQSSIEMAPLVCDDPGVDLADARDRLGRAWFGCDPRPFWAAVDAIGGVYFPFSRNRSTAIQWNRLKDSEPAPAHYLRDLIVEWQEKGAVADELQSTEAAIDSITAGRAQLDAFTNTVRQGTAILHAWSRAAEMQLWQARLAKTILTDDINPQLLSWIQALRDDFRHLLAGHETPLSAEKNAGLVYDPIIEYISSKK